MSKKSYTKEEIIDLLEKGIEDMSSLYKKPYINYKGETKGKADERRLYYEIIAEYLLEHINLFSEKNIKEITRKQPHPQTHKPLTDEEKKEIEKQVRFEEWSARNLLGHNFAHIGIIREYQYPLKGKKRQPGIGKIDLIAYKEELNKKSILLSIIEFKRKDNKETLLRAILEITTYYFQVDKKKLNETFPYSDIQKVVLIFKDSPLHQQYKSNLIKKLAAKLKVKVLVLDDNKVSRP